MIAEDLGIPRIHKVLMCKYDIIFQIYRMRKKQVDSVANSFNHNSLTKHNEIAIKSWKSQS